MYKIIFTSLLLFLISSVCHAQNNNFRAQGFYYKAKELKESGSYSNAIPYCKKAEEALGGSNLELQYLYILCYYYSRDYSNAQKEMERFFNFKGDQKDQIKKFDKSVDRITDDETKAVTQLMVDIDEKAHYESTHTTCGNCSGTGTESYHKDCFSCNGKGYESYQKACSNCNGNGGSYIDHGTAVGKKWHKCAYCFGKAYYTQSRKCSDCSGKGYNSDTRTCTRCFGKGKVAKE